MKIQLEELDLLRPWPALSLRPGYYAIRLLVRIGSIPLGEVMTRPARSRRLLPRRIARRIARTLAVPLIKQLSRLAMAAGPEAMRAFPEMPGPLVGNSAGWRRTAIGFAQHELLVPSGLPQPFREIYEKGIAAAESGAELPPVTVAICTRDRADQLERCLRHLLKQDYPDFDILVVDNSRCDHGPTFEVARRLGANYVREAAGGLSRARNAALRAAQSRWVAFTDDDCQPEFNWLRELVRELQDTRCRCVTGLVLPAQLENSAEIVFEIYGGLGRGYFPITFDRSFLRKSRWAPGQTWRIGAGANMLLDRDLLLREIGGYDVDMGPGPSSIGGCGEDTDVFYRILRRGMNIHYTPRAIVHHYHRSSPEALRKHIYSYAVGHAAYHVRCLFAYRDHRSLLQLTWFLPRWFARNYKRGVLGKTRYPFSLVPLEVKGTVVGAVGYSWLKVKRFFREKWESLGSGAKPQAGRSPVQELSPARSAEGDSDKTYDVAIVEKSPRAA